MPRRLALAASAVFALALGSAAIGDEPPGATVISTLDLTGPFATRSPWRFVATQGPCVADPLGPFADLVPGPVSLCLTKGEAGPCRQSLAVVAKGAARSWVSLWRPHFLNVAMLVHPRGMRGSPLLLVQSASLHSGDGDQVIYTQLLAYRAPLDRFEQVYEHQAGHNNNEEVRYVRAGPLAGDMISADPTGDPPFGYWIEVDALTPAYAYSRVLRFRSATRYNDGNSLAVIDAEMPNIEARLGLWRRGAPLPLPGVPCANPRLVHMELWCS